MTVSRNKQRVAALLTVASLALVPLEQATAHRYNADTRSGIVIARRKFHGKVKSAKRFCRYKRNVTMWKIKQGPDKRIGTDRSRGGGYWEVKVKPVRGKRYYATVASKKKKKYRHSHRCKSGRSRVRTA